MAQQPMYPGMINSPQTELSAAISDTAVSISVTDASKLPPAPNLATIGTDETAETILYTGKSGNNLTGVTRAFEGAAKSWSAGAKIARNFTNRDFESILNNIEDHETRIVASSGEIANVSTEVSAQKAETVTRIFNVVTGYGADPTGVEDSTAAIQAALDEIEAAGGGILYFPRGVYKVTYSLFYGSNLTIQGYGAMIMFTPSQANATCFVPITYTSATEYIENIVMEGFKLNSSSDKGNGIGTPKVKNMVVRDVYTDQLHWHLVDMAGGKNITVENCHAENLSTAAFQADNLSVEGGMYAELSDGSLVSAIIDNDNCDVIRVLNCSVKNGTGYGVHMHRTGGKDILVQGCTFENLGIAIVSDENTVWHNVSIVNNTIRNCVNGIDMKACHHGVKIDGNDISEITGPFNFGIAVRQNMSQSIIGGGSKNHRIVNNTVKNAPRGIALDWSLSGIVANNILEGCGIGQTTDYNGSKSPSHYGVSIYLCSNIEVKDNIFLDCPICGIRVNVDSTTRKKLSITGNTFENSGNAIVFMGFTLSAAAYTTPNYTDVIVSDNIVGLGQYGFIAFVLGGIKKVKVINNIVKTNNNIGLELDYCSDINVQGNDVSISTLATSGSRFGISLFGSRGWIENNKVSGWESLSTNIGIRTADDLIEGKTDELPNVAFGGTTKIEYPASSIPTTALLKVGSTARNTAPASAGYIGWVYTSSGWKGFGLIA